MADIKTVKLGGTTYNIADASAVASVTYNSSTGIVTVTKRNGTSSTFEVKSGGTEVWIGTKAQYNAITTKDANKIYITTDEASATFIDSATFTNYQATVTAAFTAEPDILYGTSDPTSSQGKNGDIYVKYTA